MKVRIAFDVSGEGGVTIRQDKGTYGVGDVREILFEDPSVGCAVNEYGCFLCIPAYAYVDSP